MKEPFLITEEQYKSLFNENISKKNYNNIVTTIISRINYIISDLGKVSWWNFPERGNTVCFENSVDGEYLTIDGEYRLPEPYDKVYNWFPIEWLWQDYKNEAKQEIEKFRLRQAAKKEKNKLRRELLKEKKADMKRIILEKLTPEELKYIKFK